MVVYYTAMSVHESQSKARLYGNSPPVDPDCLQQKFADWSAGLVVASQVDIVGRLPLPAESRSLLRDPLLLERPYGEVLPVDALSALTGPLRRALRDFAMADLGWAGLHQSVMMQTHAGMYAPGVHAEPRHVDNFGFQQVRWTVAHGLAGTVGALGVVSKADLTGIPGDGTIRPDIPDERFQQLAAAEGEVLRFTVSDVHASCQESGPRVLTVATWMTHFG